MDPRQKALIEALTSNRMGPPPGAAPTPPPSAAPDAASMSAAAAAAAGQPASAQPTPPHLARTDTNTATDSAATAGAPNDEASRMASDAILYEVDFGGAKRKLTPQQITSTFERYRDLNFEHSQLKPVLDLVKKHGVTPDKLAQLLESPSTFGANSKANGDGSAATTETAAPSTDDDLSKWERENAAVLPPGYKDLLKANGATKKQLDEVTTLLKKLVEGTAAVAGAATNDARGAAQQRASAIQQAIKVNLERTAGQLQLPDNAAKDFFTFAAERGYTMEDFIDPHLTAAVMTDFKNSLNSPELERMKQIAARRQAFTGALGQSAAAGAAAGEGAAPPSRFDQLNALALKQRGIVP